MDEFPRKAIEALWAPWRVEYFQAEHRAANDFFTEAAQTSDDAAHLVVSRGKHAFIIMNKYPYSAGHLMVAPYRKVSDMAALGQAEVWEIWQLSIHAQRLLNECVKAQGFNVGWNLGRAAGAGVDDHLHLHVVPRWVGDSNFMTVTGGTRIIPEGLRPLYDRLIAAQEKLGAFGAQ